MLGPVIEDTDVPYQFTDFYDVKSNGLHPKKLQVCRANTIKEGASNSVMISVGKEKCILSQHKAIEVGRNLIKRATTKQGETEMTHIDIRISPETLALHTLINSMDYRITIGDLMKQGVPRGTARNILDRLVRDGVIYYAGEMRGKMKVYTGTIPVGDLLTKLNQAGKQ
jgi:hypothetical protein